MAAKINTLDSFCCEGGAGMGYHRAGHKVTGVDLFRYLKNGKLVGHAQKRYPFLSWQSDAIQFIEAYGKTYDFIHASPPCWLYSITNAARQAEYPDLIASVREALIATGKPYVIENVVRAPLINPVTYCGCMFDLKAVDTDGIQLYMTRKRLFESNLEICPPRPCDDKHMQWIGGSYGGARRDKYEAKFVRKGGYVPSIPVQRELLGIDWMTQTGMFQSIPPAYTKDIGEQVNILLG